MILRLARSLYLFQPAAITQIGLRIPCDDRVNQNEAVKEVLWNRNSWRKEGTLILACTSTQWQSHPSPVHPSPVQANASSGKRPTSEHDCSRRFPFGGQNSPLWNRLTVWTRSISRQNHPPHVFLRPQPIPESGTILLG